MKKTTTDSDENFSISELPPGYYLLTMNIGDGWAVLVSNTFGSTQYVQISPGQDTQTGTITIKPQEK